MTENTEMVFNDPELEIALSQIRIGCIPYIFDGENFLIFRDNEDKINSLVDCNKINISFELIERPEFPTVSTNFFINTQKNLNIKYEYFFLTESEIELNFLRLLIKNRKLNLFFITDIIKCKHSVDIPEQECEKLESILKLL